MRRHLPCLLLIIASLASCDKTDPPAYSPLQPDTPADMLTWELSNARYPGVSAFEAGSFSIGNKGYLVNQMGHLWEYEPAANTWKRKKELPFPPPPRPDGWFNLSYPTAFSIGSKGYVTLGHIEFHYPDGIEQGPFTALWEYDPGTDTWSEKQSFQGIPRIQPAVICSDRSALVGLGFPEKNGAGVSELHSDFSLYDQTANKWTAVDVGEAGIVFAAGVYMQNSYFLIGTQKKGTGLPSDYVNRVFQFNPASGQWKILSTIAYTRNIFSYGTVFQNKAYLADITDNNKAGYLYALNPSTGATDRLGVFPEPYRPGELTHLLRIENRLYLVNALQKTVYTCKLD